MMTYIIEQLNYKDGLSRGKAKLKNITIQELKDKYSEIYDRQQGNIDDVDTSTRLMKHLNFFKSQYSQTIVSEVEFGSYLQSQGIKDYLKRQVFKKFKEYSDKLQTNKINEIINHMLHLRALKAINTESLRNQFIYDNINLEFDPDTARLVAPKKTGETSLLNIIDNYFLINNGTKELFLEHFKRLFPEHTDTVQFTQLDACLASIEAEQEKMHSSSKPTMRKYAAEPSGQLSAGYREPDHSEIIATPQPKDILGINFHYSMPEESWTQARNFQFAMREQGINLDFFCYDPDNPTQKLLGPFNYLQAREFCNPKIAIENALLTQGEDVLSFSNQSKLVSQSSTQEQQVPSADDTTDKPTGDSNYDFFG